MYGRTVQHVVEMLNSKGMHANKQFTNTNPLVAAIRSHKVDNAGQSWMLVRKSIEVLA
jgi:hypothetical protein